MNELSEREGQSVATLRIAQATTTHQYTLAKINAALAAYEHDDQMKEARELVDKIIDAYRTCSSGAEGSQQIATTVVLDWIQQHRKPCVCRTLNEGDWNAIIYEAIEEKPVLGSLVARRIMAGLAELRGDCQ